MLKNFKNNILHTKEKRVNLYIFGDWHIGAKGCNIKLIQKYINMLAKDPLGYAVCTGDLLDNVIYSSKGLVHEQAFFGTEQVSKVIELLTPVKHKILAAISGNHEKRTVKSACIDIMKVICDNLGILYKGSEYRFGINLQKRKVIYCFAAHNTGGGATSGAKINRLEALHWRGAFSHIIVAGHTHHQSDSEKLIIYLDKFGNTRKQIQHFICCGTALESDEGYAAEMSLPPVPVGFKIVKINYRSDVMDVQVDVDKVK